MDTSGLGIADIKAIAGDSDSDGFGGGMGGLMWIIVLFALMGGNGGGLFGGNGNQSNADLASLLATKNDLSLDRQFAELNNGLNFLTAQVNTDMLSVRTAQDAWGAANQKNIAESNYMNLSNFKDLSAQGAKCCCDTNQHISQVQFETSKAICESITNQNMNTRDLLAAQTAGTQRILDKMCEDKEQALYQRINTLETATALQAQNNQLIRELKPTPSPAWIVNSPYVSGCGCGACCGL